MLEPVGLDPNLQGVAGDVEQVHEEPGPDHLVQEHLADAVVRGEALERGSLGVVVVVDVHARVCPSAFGQEVDERARGDCLLIEVMGPPRVIGPHAVGFAEDEPEQEEEAGVSSPERVPLEVEEHVPVIGLGHQ